MDIVASEQNDATKPHLSVCIVTFKPDPQVLARTLESLRIALARLEHTTSSVLIVDNSPADTLTRWLREHFPNLTVALKTGHGNVGCVSAWKHSEPIDMHRRDRLPSPAVPR